MLAVLPFANLTGDTDQEYIGDGMTEELIAQLGKMDPSRLGVIARQLDGVDRAGLLAHAAVDAAQLVEDERGRKFVAVRPIGRRRGGFYRLLSLFELEKLVYELRYEARNRPDWASIPVIGLLRLLGTPG